jgi:hypothetical protein
MSQHFDGFAPGAALGLLAGTAVTSSAAALRALEVEGRLFEAIRAWEAQSHYWRLRALAAEALAEDLGAQVEELLERD